MLCMCIVQRNLGQVMISGIQACMCMQYFVIIDRAFVAFCYVTGMCRMIKNDRAIYKSENKPRPK